MPDCELQALYEALREWRYQCDNRGRFARPGSYTMATMRHDTATPEHPDSAVRLSSTTDDLVRRWGA
jgi:hypothetical protein